MGYTNISPLIVLTFCWRHQKKLQKDFKRIHLSDVDILCWSCYTSLRNHLILKIVPCEVTSPGKTQNLSGHHSTIHIDASLSHPHLPGLAGTLASETWWSQDGWEIRSRASEFDGLLWSTRNLISFSTNRGPNCQVTWNTGADTRNCPHRNLHKKCPGRFFFLPILATGNQLSTSEFWGKEILMPLGQVATYRPGIPCIEPLGAGLSLGSP